MSINEIWLDLPDEIQSGLTNIHRWPIGGYLCGNNLVVLDLRSSQASEAIRNQNRRLIELQPFCSVVLEIAEPK
ncbi:MAG: hypothetical protein U0930_00590 [Pirellulales bacterium]